MNLCDCLNPLSFLPGQELGVQFLLRRPVLLDLLGLVLADFFTLAIRKRYAFLVPRPVRPFGNIGWFEHELRRNTPLLQLSEPLYALSLDGSGLLRSFGF